MRLELPGKNRSGVGKGSTSPKEPQGKVSLGLPLHPQKDNPQKTGPLHEDKKTSGGTKSIKLAEDTIINFNYKKKGKIRVKENIHRLRITYLGGKKDSFRRKWPLQRQHGEKTNRSQGNG